MADDKENIKMTSLETEEVEKWLDQHSAFFKEYFIKKVSRDGNDI